MSSDFALRRDQYAGLIHYFRKRDLADPDLSCLIPWCQEDETFPVGIPRDEVTIEGVGDAVPCGRCIYRDLECGE